MKILPQPIVIADVTYDQYTVEPLFFVKFVELLSDAREQQDDDDAFQKARNRATIRSQVTLHGGDGKKTKLDDLQISNLAIPNGRVLLRDAFDAPGTAGQIISKDADGITKSIVFKLGQPINTAAASITELEFSAKTFGDIEAILAETNALTQTKMLLKTLAKPAGALVLPSWAYEKISVADGLAITEKILPSFL